MKTIAEKITLLNKVTLSSLGERNKLVIVKKFTEASIKILDADFGFAWSRRDVDDEYQLAYKSKDTPYDPNPPRKQGGNAKARRTGIPVFVEDTAKEKYAPQYDVSPYMKSYIIIPIVYENNFYGNIVLCYTKQKKYSDDDQSLALALGNSLGQALTISRLHTNLTSFQQTLDNTLDSIFIFTPDLTLQYVNKGATHLTGLSKKQLYKKTLPKIISGLTDTELFAKMLLVQDKENSPYTVFESHHHLTDKTKIAVEISLQYMNQAGERDQFLAVVRDISLRKEAENSMAKMAYYDQLTGIANRSLLTERLAKEHARAEKNKGMYGVFFMDLDRFKIINDIYGHHAGDTLLKMVATRLKKAVPKRATVARMGGDEFLVLLPNVKAMEEAESCAADIQTIFTDFFTINDQEIYCNGSLGYAVYPLDGSDHFVVMKHADLALHRAKEHGGSNIQQYHSGQPLFYTMQPKLQNQLRKALKRGELLLEYQPIINVRQKRITSCEALVRWNHPEMGLIYPGDFVGQAEESGLIIEMGEWVIHEVCRQIQEWEGDGRIPPPVSINLSPRELLRPTLVENIDKTLKEFKISPSQIKLELTETFLMKNIDLSISILEQLKALGLRILIDDFGTGYASLNYLKLLPIDAVKIDKTFIAGVPTSLQDAALTSAIIAISHQLGLEVIAEGVETKDQFDFLRAAQCNFAQGNFFFKPVSGEQLADLLSLAHGN